MGMRLVHEPLEQGISEYVNLELYKTNKLYKALVESMPIKVYSRISAINSIKHGMNHDYLLPCQKENCFYKDLCFIAMENNLKDMSFGEPCPHEFALYLHLAVGYSVYFADRQEEEGLVKAIFNLIMMKVKLNRSSGMMAIEGGMLPREGIPSWNYKGLSLTYRYSSSLWNKSDKLMDKLLGII
jgi:hypothetical protein